MHSEGLTTRWVAMVGPLTMLVSGCVTASEPAVRPQDSPLCRPPFSAAVDAHADALLRGAGDELVMTGEVVIRGVDAYCAEPARPWWRVWNKNAPSS